MNITWTVSDENFKNSSDKESLWIFFKTDDKISKIEKTYKNSNEANHSPVASKLFGFPWVDEIKVAPTGILIKRQDWVDFDIIAEPLKELIEEHFKTTVEPYEENPEAPAVEVIGTDTTGLNEQESLIVNFLDQEVNPQVAGHGGRISFIKLEGTTAHLKMEGGCQGCSMAAATLKDGVEKSLIESFDFITSVVDTTDHDSGVKPYFN